MRLGLVLLATLLTAAPPLRGQAPFSFDLKRPDREPTPARILTTIIGGEPLEWSGFALAGGDINADGLADLVIAAPGGSDDRPSRRGRIYIVLGRIAFPASINLKLRRTVTVIPAAPLVYSSGADIVIEGEDDFDHMGRALAVADFDGDGFDDIAIGVPSADGPANGRTDSGEVLVMYGSPDWPGLIAPARSVAGLRIRRVFGASRGDGLGAALAVGDLTGDGRPDLVVGAPGARGVVFPEATQETGAFFVIDLTMAATGVTDLAVRGQPGVIARIHGGAGAERAGAALATGDFDGDGAVDLMAGAPGADSPDGQRPDAGMAGLLFGPIQQGTEGKLVEVAAAVFTGPHIGDSAGSHLASGDIDGDGLDDMLIGAVLSDGRGGARLDAGGALVVRGRDRSDLIPADVASPKRETVRKGAFRVDLARPRETRAFILHGDDPGDHATAAGAVDLDGDGAVEILMTAADSSSRRNSRGGGGEATVFFGGTMGAVFWGPVGGAHLGRGIAALDMDGDGRRELILGSPWGGQALSGRIHILSVDWSAIRQRMEK